MRHNVGGTPDIIQVPILNILIQIVIDYSVLYKQ